MNDLRATSNASKTTPTLEQSAAMLKLELIRMDTRDAEFLAEAKKQIDQITRASRLQAMREDAPTPVSASVDPELYEALGNPSEATVAAAARELQEKAKSQGRNISTVEAVNAVMPRNWRKKS